MTWESTAVIYEQNWTYCFGGRGGGDGTRGTFLLTGTLSLSMSRLLKDGTFC